MRFLIFVLFFIFLQANDSILQTYKVKQKLITINNNFIKMINKINHNDIKVTLELLDSGSEYPMPYILKLYQNDIQKYFRHLKQKSDKIKLVLSYKNVKEVQEEVNDMIIIHNIAKDIHYISQKKLNGKILYKDIIQIIDSEIFLIKVYNIEPNYVIVQKGSKKARILKVLLDIKKQLEMNYNKNIKPYNH